jgi:hypothetical protein
MNVITALHPDSRPRTTFSVVVSNVSLPGHPWTEYSVETHHGSGDEPPVYVATTEGAEIVRHHNVGALLSLLLETP